MFPKRSKVDVVAQLKQLEHGPGSACALQLESQNPDLEDCRTTQSSPSQIYLGPILHTYLALIILEAPNVAEATDTSVLRRIFSGP